MSRRQFLHNMAAGISTLPFYGYNCQRNAHNLYPQHLEDNNVIHELKGNMRRRTGKQYAPQLIADRALDFVRQNKDKPFFLYYPTVIPQNKDSVTIRLDHDVLVWFREMGRGYQTKINAVLRSYMKSARHV